MDAHVTRETNPVQETLAKLVRTILCIIQAKRPLTDFDWLRALQVANGLIEMDATSGVLSDPSANCSSPQFVKEIVHLFAESTRDFLRERWAKSPTLGLSCDEVSGIDGHAYLVAYVQSLDDEGKSASHHMCTVKLELNQEALREWAEAEMGSTLPEKFIFRLKSGLNMAYHIDQYRKDHFAGSFCWKKVTSVGMDGAG